jgi:starvation-inducible DNA-binding protein
MKTTPECPPNQHRPLGGGYQEKKGLTPGEPMLRPPVPEAGLGTQIGLAPSTCHRVIETLQRLLSDEIALSLKTRNFQWNVEGLEFYPLHRLSRSQVRQLDGMADEVAERIRAVGGFALGSMHECMALTRIPEVGGGNPPDPEVRMERLLLDDHEQLIREIRTLIDALSEWGDAGTQLFVTGLLVRHEKMAWMLRATLACKRG